GGTKDLADIEVMAADRIADMGLRLADQAIQGGVTMVRIRRRVGVTEGTVCRNEREGYGQLPFIDTVHPVYRGNDLAQHLRHRRSRQTGYCGCIFSGTGDRQPVNMPHTSMLA